MDKDKRDIINKDFQVTNEVRQYVYEHPEQFINTPARVHMGHFYTSEEADKYIDDSLKRPLPNDKVNKGPVLGKFFPKR